MASLVEWLEIKQRIANRDAAFGVMPDRRYGQAATAITALEAMCETLAEHLQGALHEADWMITKIALNPAARAGVEGRFYRAHQALTQYRAMKEKNDG